MYRDGVDARFRAGQYRIGFEIRTPASLRIDKLHNSEQTLEFQKSVLYLIKFTIIKKILFLL